MGVASAGVDWRSRRPWSGGRDSGLPYACATRKAERLSVTLSPLLTCSPRLPMLLDCLME